MRLAGDTAQAADIFGETAAAEPGARIEVAGADALVESHASGYGGDIGAVGLADIGNLVDEGDLGGQHRIGGVFNHFGTCHIGRHLRAGIQDWIQYRNLRPHGTCQSGPRLLLLYPPALYSC